MALLGWSYDDHTEVMSREELVERFTLERVGKSAAVFDYDKLKHLNGLYLRALPPDEYADRLVAYLRERGYEWDEQLVREGGAARPGEDRDVRRLPRLRRVLLRAGRARRRPGRRGASRGGRSAGAESSRSKPERSRRRYAGSPSGSGSSRVTRFSPFAWRSPGRRSRPASSRASSSSAARSRSCGSQAAAAATPAGRALAETPATHAAGRSVSDEGSSPQNFSFLSDKTVERGKQIRGVRNCRPARCRRS